MKQPNSFLFPVRIGSLSGHYLDHVDGLVQEIRNSIANALELILSCTNPSMFRLL